MVMLIYLANNSRPDITFAVHHYSRFTHTPRHSHAMGIKHIIRYLNETKDKGMTITPTKEHRIDCYVDVDFFGIDQDQDPISVKSKTGYIIKFMGVPLQWVSKLQNQIILGTMEAEYIALSQSMRDLISLRELLKEINRIFLTDSNTTSFHSYSNTFTLPQSIVYEDNQACLKCATMPKTSPRTKYIAVSYHFF